MSLLIGHLLFVVIEESRFVMLKCVYDLCKNSVDEFLVSYHPVQKQTFAFASASTVEV